MLDRILEDIRSKGLKNTPRRRAVINLFLEESVYLNPLEVRAKLSSRDINVGIPSVYRILEELNHAGILKKTEKSDRYLYYYLCFPSDSHHHHFFCNNCRKVIHLGKCSFMNDISPFDELDGCTVDKHYFSIEGRCRSCNYKGA